MSNPISPAPLTAHSARAGGPTARTAALACAAALCCVVLIITAARIEMVNVAAGVGGGSGRGGGWAGVLPRTERRLDTGERIAWRVIPHPATDWQRARNELRGLVRTWGLAQHLIALAAIGCGLALRPRRSADRAAPRWPRVIGAAAMLTGAAALALAVARGYFTSAFLGV